MKQRFAIILLGCLGAALIALAGCAPAAPASDTARAEFPGVWEVVRLDDGQRVIEGAELDRLRDLDMHIYLELCEDGRAVLRTFDEEEEGSWTAESPATAVMAFPDGQQVAMELQGSTLSFSQDEDRLEFQKTDLAEMPPLVEVGDAAENGTEATASEGGAS